MKKVYYILCIFLLRIHIYVCTYMCVCNKKIIQNVIINFFVIVTFTYMYVYMYMFICMCIYNNNKKIKIKINRFFNMIKELIDF